jgi:hypothetical protein
VENVIYAPLKARYYRGDLGRLQLITWDLLESAKLSVHVVGDQLNSSFYQNPRTLDVLQRLVARGVSLQLVHGSEADTGALAALKEIGVELFRVDNPPDHHFAVVDGRHVKVEAEHTLESNEREYFIKYDTKVLGQDLEQKFASLLKRAHPASEPPLGEEGAGGADRGRRKAG